MVVDDIDLMLKKAMHLTLICDFDIERESQFFDHLSPYLIYSDGILIICDTDSRQVEYIEIIYLLFWPSLDFI